MDSHKVFDAGLSTFIGHFYTSRCEVFIAFNVVLYLMFGDLLLLVQFLRFAGVFEVRIEAWIALVPYIVIEPLVVMIIAIGVWRNIVVLVEVVGKVVEVLVAAVGIEALVIETLVGVKSLIALAFILHLRWVINFT